MNVARDIGGGKQFGAEDENFNLKWEKGRRGYFSEFGLDEKFHSVSSNVNLVMNETGMSWLVFGREEMAISNRGTGLKLGTMEFFSTIP